MRIQGDPHSQCEQAFEIGMRSSIYYSWSGDQIYNHVDYHITF